jgi:trehalose 6-phosphate synthase/phosphatase
VSRKSAGSLDYWRIEHGAWLNTDGTWGLAHELSGDWKETIRPILERVVEQTPGSILEEKDDSLVWHYRMTDPEFGLWQARELCSQLQGMLAGSELQVQSGNKVVEVKWSTIHKGVAASQIIERAQPVDFILALGDDHTDEDMRRPKCSLPKVDFTSASKQWYDPGLGINQY